MVMDLYLLRHAEAGEAPRDVERQLTAHGHEQASAAAAGIAWLRPHVDALVSSPLPRALQTADPVATALGLPLAVDDALATGRDADTALAVLGGYSDGVLLVGHEPQLSGIIEKFTGGRAHMRKAMLARVEVWTLTPPEGTLAWLLSWRHLERLGRR